MMQPYLEATFHKIILYRSLRVYSELPNRFEFKRWFLYCIVISVNSQTEFLSTKWTMFQ